MELAPIIISAIALGLTILGVAWAHGRKIGTICTRLDVLSRNQGEMTLVLNRLEGRMKALEMYVSRAITELRVKNGGSEHAP